MSETVTIPTKEYIKLIKDSLKLQALDAGGVDNWDWYDDAMELYREWVAEKKL